MLQDGQQCSHEWSLCSAGHSVDICYPMYSEMCHMILKFYSKNLCFLVMYILFDSIIPLVKYYKNWDNTFTVQTRQEAG